jgi:hypothetical protein
MASWWDIHDIDTAFETPEDVATKIFGIELPPQDVGEFGGEFLRRAILTRITDLIVERVTQRLSLTSANDELMCISDSLGYDPFCVTYDYKRARRIRPLAWVNFAVWRSAWQDHLKLIVFGHKDLNFLECVIVDEVPTFMHHVETCI